MPQVGDTRPGGPSLATRDQLRALDTLTNRVRKPGERPKGVRHGLKGGKR